MSLKSTILQYVKDNYPTAVHKGIIGRRAVNEWGYENENAGRRCRDLVAEGKIEPIYNKKHEVMYRWRPESETLDGEPSYHSPPKIKRIVPQISAAQMNETLQKINSLNPYKVPKVAKAEQKQTSLFKA